MARSEAHLSALCAVPAAVKRQLANDLLNIALADPVVNRFEKVEKDAAGWLPLLNRCWFADRVLSECVPTAMIFRSPAPVAPTVPSAAASRAGFPLERWDDNGNGRITCAEARAHWIAPVARSNPAYPFMTDGDRDGIVSE